MTEPSAREQAYDAILCYLTQSYQPSTNRFDPLPFWMQPHIAHGPYGSDAPMCGARKEAADGT